MEAARPADVEAERAPRGVKAGGCAFHHSLTFHGSGGTRRLSSAERWSPTLVPAHTRFHPQNTDVTYSLYRRRGDLALDESFFPVIWDESGGRSAWLAALPELP